MTASRVCGNILYRTQNTYVVVLIFLITCDYFTYLLVISTYFLTNYLRSANLLTRPAHSPAPTLLLKLTHPPKPKHQTKKALTLGQDCQIPLKNLKIGPDLTELGTMRS